MDNTNTNNKSFDIFTSMTIARTASAIIKRFWLVLVVALFFALCFFSFAKMIYEEEYKSATVIALTTTTYVNALDDNGNPIKIVSQQKIYDESDSNKYQVLLRSDRIVNAIQKEIGNQFTKQDIRKSLSLSKASTAGIFNVEVKCSDAEYCSAAIRVVNKEFPDYLKSFDPSLGVVIVNDPNSPVVSNATAPLKLAVLGFLFGALIVMIIIYISELVRDTVKSTDDIRLRLSIRVLGAMPTVEHNTRGKLRRKAIRYPLLNNENRVSFAFVESFKTIRARIENSTKEDGHNVFAVTSTFENEGKTTVAVNLACALSQNGKTVLMIDCDLRMPSVLKMIGIREDGKSGVIQIVKKESTCAASVKYIKRLGCFVLPSGGSTNKSTEIIGSEEFRTLIKQVREEFDYVIIDTPPAHVVADCLVIAPYVDSLIFAIRNDYAKTKDIIHTIEDLESAGVEILGSVLTMTDEAAVSSYFSARKGSSYYSRNRKRYGGYYAARPIQPPSSAETDIVSET